MQIDDMSDVGCLLIHGFGGGPKEVEPIAQKLSKEGFKVLLPVLKGHTGIKRDLRDCTYMEWIESADKGLEALMKECGKIFIIGFSMGGLIAFQLALKYKVMGIATINTPIYFWDFKHVADNIKSDIANKRLDNIKRYVNSSKALPLSALVNFRLLLSKTKRVLRNIDCPLFVAQALKDDTVRKKSAQYILNGVSSKRKEIRFYKNSGHQMLVSSEAENVTHDILNFFYELLI